MTLRSQAEQIISAAEIPDSVFVTEWSQNWRRAFLLAAPISIPLYLGIWLFCIVVMVILFCTITPILWLASGAQSLWTGKPGFLE